MNQILKMKNKKRKILNLEKQPKKPVRLNISDLDLVRFQS